METTERKRAKRHNGDGSYRERPDGTWECRITLEDGRRKSIYGKTLAECRSKRQQAERDIERGLDITAKPQTVKTFLLDWLENTAKPTLRPKTHHSYAQLTRLHLIPALGHLKLAKLAPTDVQKLMRDMTARGLSPRTVQYTRAVLRRALGYALKWGLVTRNVATLVDPPRSVKKPVKPLTAAQARAFLDYVEAQNDRLLPFLTVAIYTGLRLAELMGLRWSDVDLDAGVLRVRHTLQRIDGTWQFVEPKTKRSARALSLPADAVAALRVQSDRQAFERKRAADEWHDLDLVFSTPKGTSLEPSNLSKRLHALLAGAGLPKQGMHALRHCCASLLAAQGVTMREIMEQLGHSQLSLTSDLYVHLAPAMLKANADALGAALARSKTG